MASSHTADPPAEPQAPPQPFDPSEPFVSVPSVSVKALQSPVTALTLPSALALHGMEDASAHLSVAPTVQLVTDEWERAVETLYLSLRQHNVCCLKLPDIMAKVRLPSLPQRLELSAGSSADLCLTQSHGSGQGRLQALPVLLDLSADTCRHSP